MNELSTKPTEKLAGEYRALKVIVIALFAVVILLETICIYGFLTQDKPAVYIALAASGMACGAIIPLLFVNMNKIKKELANR